MSTMDRRTFLKRSGLAAGAGAFASQLPYGAIGPAVAAKEGDARRLKEAHRLLALLGRLRGRRHGREWRVDAASLCSNRRPTGAHCAKGASIREHGVAERTG
jgi:formate dehydrogenase major subunit